MAELNLIPEYTIKLVGKIKRRLGHPSVSIYTSDDAIMGFIEDSVDKMKIYSVGSMNCREVVGVCSDGRLTKKFNNVLQVYPEKHNESSTASMFPTVFVEEPFSWKVVAGEIFVSGARGRVIVEYAGKEVTYEDLTLFYQDLAYKYALALTKECEARIRGKFRVNSSPFEIDASDLLSEAESMKSEVEDILSSQPILKSATI